MKDGGLDAGEAEEPVVEHLLEDLEVAQEGGGWLSVAVDADRVGIRLDQRETIGQGGCAGSCVPCWLVRTCNLIAETDSTGSRYQKVRKNTYRLGKSGSVGS